MIIEIQGYTINTKDINSISPIRKYNGNLNKFYINMGSNVIQIESDNTEYLKFLHSQTVECFRGIYKIRKIE